LRHYILTPTFALITLIWFLVSAIPFMGPLVLDTLLVLLIVFAFIDRIDFATLKRDRFYLLMLLQYPIWNIFRNYLGGGGAEISDTGPEGYQMWLFSILAIVLVFWFFNRVEITTKRLSLIIYASVCTTFAVSCYFYFELGQCRVVLWNPNVFSAPMFVSVLVIIALCLNTGDMKFKFHAMPLLVISLVTSLAFAGARGIFVGQVISFSIAAIIFLTKRETLKFWGVLLSILLGILGTLAVESYSGCNNFGRLRALGDVFNLTKLEHTKLEVKLASIHAKFDFTDQSNVFATIPQSSAGSDIRNANVLQLNQARPIEDVFADTSMQLRWKIWAQAIDKIKDQPLWGSGAANDRAQTTQAHPHVHNMYLSWLIWGGVFGLVSGLVFLFANVSSAFLENRPVIGIGVSLMFAIFWASSMLFDSFLRWEHYTYVFIIYSVIIQRCVAKRLVN